MLKRLSSALLLSGLVTLGACGEEAKPAAVQQRIDSTIPATVDHAGAAFSRLEDNESLARLTEGLDAVDDALAPMQLGYLADHLGLGSSEETDGAFEPAGRFLTALRNPQASSKRSAKAADEPTDEPSPGEQIATALKEQIFTEANYQGDGIYKIPVDLVCSEESADGPATIDPDCAATFEQLDLRIAAELVDDDGLDLALLVGADDARPISFELRPTSVAAALDLGGIDKTIELLASLGQEDGEPVPAITAEGVIAVTVRASSDSKADLELAIREAVKVDIQADADHVHFEAAKADPAVAFRIDGDAVELAVDFHRIALTLPRQAVIEDGGTGDFSLDLPGLSYKVALPAAADALSIENIGIGDGAFTAKLGSETLFSAEINTVNDHRFNATITPSDSGLPIVTLAPGLDLALGFHLALLGDASVPSWLLDDTYRIRIAGLNGADPSLQSVETFDGAGKLAVLTGSLLVEHNGERMVEVAAGQCLQGDVDDAGAPVLSSVSCE